MDPKREKIISRSSSVVTGFSLQTKRTFSGGLTSASGRSPTWGTYNSRPKDCNLASPLTDWEMISSYHLQQDGPSFCFLLAYPLLQLLCFFPLCIIDHLICSNSTTLHSHGRNSWSYIWSTSGVPLFSRNYFPGRFQPLQYDRLVTTLYTNTFPHSTVHCRSVLFHSCTLHFVHLPRLLLCSSSNPRSLI